jgi:hypothetical protein
VYKGAGRRADGDGHSVRDGVVDRNELEVEWTDLNALTFDDNLNVGFDAMLAQLCFDESERETRTDDSQSLLLAQQKWQATYVVFVRVREHDRIDVVEAITDVGEVRKDEVDTRLVLFREQHTDVDDEQPSAEFNDSHVAADLAEATESNDAQTLRVKRWRIREIVRGRGHGLPVV